MFFPYKCQITYTYYTACCAMPSSMYILQTSIQVLVCTYITYILNKLRLHRCDSSWAGIRVVWSTAVAGKCRLDRLTALSYIKATTQSIPPNISSQCSGWWIRRLLFHRLIHLTTVQMISMRMMLPKTSHEPRNEHRALVCMYAAITAK